MAVELRNVDTLAPPPGYSHVAVGRGGTVVFTAGRCRSTPEEICWAGTIRSRKPSR
jgi:hypothetical protein